MKSTISSMTLDISLKDKKKPPPNPKTNYLEGTGVIRNLHFLTFYLYNILTYLIRIINLVTYNTIKYYSRIDINVHIYTYFLKNKIFLHTIGLLRFYQTMIFTPTLLLGPT